MAKIIKKNSKALLASAAAGVKKSPAPAPAKKAAAPAKKPTASAAKSGPAALPGRYEKPLTEYSPYAQHRILLEKFGTDAAGQEKVLKHGTEVLGLPEGQVKTYIREKLNAILRDEQKKAGLHPSKPQLEKAARGETDIDFKHPSKEKALAAMLAIVRRAGTTEQAYHILSEGGKFAVVPAHIRPKGKPAPLAKGDIVLDTTIADSRAEVLEGGPEQSVIRYLTERKYAPQEQTVSNYYLHKVGTKADMKAMLADIAGKKAKRGEAAAAKKAAKVTPDTAPRKMQPLVAEKAAKTPAKKAPAKKVTRIVAAKAADKAKAKKKAK